jgi:hypothetical protein
MEHTKIIDTFETYQAAATSSRRHHHGSLLGYLDAYLHGHGPVAGLAALPSIQCLRPWSSGAVEKNGGEE